MNDKKPFYKRFVFWKWFAIVYVAFLALGAIGTFFGDDGTTAEVAEPAEKVAATKPVVATPVSVNLTDQGKLLKSAKEIYGDADVIGVEYDDSIRVAMVKLRREVGWSANTLKSTTLMDSVKFLEFAQNVPGLNAVDVRVVSPLKDAYGNTADARVMDMRFESATLDKINYANVDWRSLPQIADDYWQHPDMADK